MTQTGPSKSERVAGVALPLLFVVGTIIFAVSYRSVFSIVFAVFAAIMIPVSILRSRKVAEKEMIRRLLHRGGASQCSGRTGEDKPNDPSPKVETLWRETVWQRQLL